MTGEEYFKLKRGDTITVETPFAGYTKGQVFKVEFVNSINTSVYIRDITLPLGAQIKVPPLSFLLDNFVVGGELIKKKDNKVIENTQDMIDIKNIKGKFYQNILMGVVGEVVYAGNDRITFKKKNSSEYFYCDMEDFLKYWQPYEASDDKVNHPSHYTWLKDLCGIEVIDITRHMDFNLGNSIKYILRSGHKKEEGYTDKRKTIEDLKKAIWYLNDEISMLEKEN